METFDSWKNILVGAFSKTAMPAAHLCVARLFVCRTLPVARTKSDTCWLGIINNLSPVVWCRASIMPGTILVPRTYEGEIRSGQLGCG